MVPLAAGFVGLVLSGRRRFVNLFSAANVVSLFLFNLFMVGYLVLFQFFML